MAKRIHFTREQIQEAINKTNSIDAARKLLGTSVGTFYRFMREYGIKAKNKHGHHTPKEDVSMKSIENLDAIIDTTLEKTQGKPETTGTFTVKQLTNEDKKVYSLETDDAELTEADISLTEPDPIPARGVYEVVGQTVGKLVDEKQKAYGDIGRVHAAMKVFYPDGVPVEKLSDALLVVRILDKINRISGGDKAAFDENPFLDIAGYGLLGFTEED